MRMEDSTHMGVSKISGPDIDPKSGLAVVVQCGGTPAKACFPSGVSAADYPSSDLRLSSRARGRASETRSFLRVA